jgi:cell division protein FtsN
MLALSRAPGTIPSTVNPPRASASPSDNLLHGAPEEPRIAVAPAPTAGPTRVANAAPTAQNDGFFSSLARKVGIGGSADATATASTPPSAPPKPKVIEAKRTEAPPRPETAVPKPSAPKAVAARPALKPSVSDAPAQAAAPAPAAPSQVAGSAPIVSSNSFDSRFGAVK